MGQCSSRASSALNYRPSVDVHPGVVDQSRHAHCAYQDEVRQIVDHPNEKVGTMRLEALLLRHATRNQKIPLDLLDEWDGYTPLVCAASYGRREMVHLLVRNGANLNQKARNGETALHAAAAAGHEDLIKMLEDYGAELELVDDMGWTAFFFAAVNKHLHCCDELIELECKNDTVSYHGDLILHLVAAENYLEGCKYVLENPRRKLKPDAVTVCNLDGETPIHSAAKHGATSALAYLLQRLASLNSQLSLFEQIALQHKVLHENRFGLTPVHLAIRGGHLPTLKCLVELLPLALQTTNHDKVTCLHTAVDSDYGFDTCLFEAEREEHKAATAAGDGGGHAPSSPPSSAPVPKLEFIRFLLTFSVVEVSAADHRGITPLHLACSGPRHRALTSPFAQVLKEALLDEDDDEEGDLAEEGRKRTPSHQHQHQHQHQQGRRESVNILSMFDLSRSRSQQDGQHQSVEHMEVDPFHVACTLLLGRDADPNSPDSNGRTPVHLAAKNGHTALLELLLDSGKANLEVQDAYGMTPLLMAAMKNQTAAADLLLSRGASVFTVGSDGSSPLHIAARNGHAAAVSYLVEHGAASTSGALNLQGETALHEAVAASHLWSLSALTAKGEGAGAVDDALDHDRQLAARHGDLGGSPGGGGGGIIYWEDGTTTPVSPAAAAAVAAAAGAIPPVIAALINPVAIVARDSAGRLAHELASSLSRPYASTLKVAYEELVGVGAGAAGPASAGRATADGIPPPTPAASSFASRFANRTFSSPLLGSLRSDGRSSLSGSSTSSQLPTVVTATATDALGFDSIYKGGRGSFAGNGNGAGQEG